MIIDKLLQTLSEIEADRTYANPIRPSNAGKCARAIAYQLHFPDKMKPLGARARLVFRLGDTIEAEIKTLLKDNPPEGVQFFFPDPQEKVSFKIGDVEIVGAIDGRCIVGGEEYVVEIKSAGDYGFKKMLKGDLDYSYACQATAYQHALGLKKTLFLIYNKNTSHLQELIFHYDPFIWAEIEARFAKVLASTPEKLPAREYAPNDKGKLPWQCSYCSSVELCHPEHKVEFENNKPSLIVAQTKKEMSV